ncbi:hypothetical protein GGI17_000492 [Coemansia sp. S146]|nr:hypothetical protein GGI17_000492 [Coemansia sp. S146]
MVRNPLAKASQSSDGLGGIMPPTPISAPVPDHREPAHAAAVAAAMIRGDVALEIGHGLLLLLQAPAITSSSGKASTWRVPSAAMSLGQIGAGCPGDLAKPASSKKRASQDDAQLAKRHKPAAKAEGAVFKCSQLGCEK